MWQAMVTDVENTPAPFSRRFGLTRELVIRVMATESTQPHPGARGIKAMAKLTPPVVIARYPMQYVITLVRELLCSRRGGTSSRTLPVAHASCRVSNSDSDLYSFTRPFYPASGCPVSGFENHKHGTRNDSSFDNKDRRSAAPVEEDCHKQVKNSIVK
jgi:hypothetical protein